MPSSDDKHDKPDRPERADREKLDYNEFLQQVQEAQDLLQRAGLVAGFAGDALQGLGGGRGHLEAFESAFDQLGCCRVESLHGGGVEICGGSWH